MILSKGHTSNFHSSFLRARLMWALRIFHEECWAPAGSPLAKATSKRGSKGITWGRGLTEEVSPAQGFEISEYTGGSHRKSLPQKEKHAQDLCMKTAQAFGMVDCQIQGIEGRELELNLRLGGKAGAKSSRL